MGDTQRYTTSYLSDIDSIFLSSIEVEKSYDDYTDLMHASLGDLCQNGIHLSKVPVSGAGITQ